MKTENNFEITLRVITRLQDNGDGGYTLYLYNNADDLIREHPNSKKFNKETRKYEKTELSYQERRDILLEEDPYLNGYISYSDIRLKIVDGKPMLTEKGLSFHAGQ